MYSSNLEMRCFNTLLVLLFISLMFTYMHPVQGANILVFLPSPGRSHVLPFQRLFRELAVRGHNVTSFGYYPLKEKMANYTDVEIKGDIEMFFEAADLRHYSSIYNWIYLNEWVRYYGTQLIPYQLESIFNSPNTKFDLVFIEMYHTDGVAFPFSNRFNCPIIGLSFQSLLPIYRWILKDPMTFSYIPHVYTPHTDTMNFWQRTFNSLFGVFTILYYNLWTSPQYQNQVNQLYPLQSEDVPRIWDLTCNVSLILAEDHFSCGHVSPELPNVINVGGIHIEELKPLTQDLQSFLDSAKHGVIYVSLGTLVEPQLAVDIGVKLLKVFRKLPQKVIWKWKLNKVDRVPDNILIREWLPQLDILNHPNCVLFISHGGYHSLQEAVFSGVPILGLPFFTDQHYNTALIGKLGIGIKISPDHSNEEEIQMAINNLINDKSYTLRSRQQSVLFKDRPMSPLDTAIYWTEYVLRHKGAKHMQSAAINFYWFQYLLLDVITFCGVCIILSITILRRVLDGIHHLYAKLKNKSVKRE